MPVNEYGQMIGESMEGYTPGELPSIDFLEGRYARIEALSVEKHAEDLLAVYGPDTPREMWTYLFQEPVADMEELVSLLNQMLARKDRFYYAIIDKATGKALGTFSLMRIDQNNRVIEVGAVTFSPELRGTRIGTEAQYLLARYVFEELHYRRYEWNVILLICHPDELRSVWDLFMKEPSVRQWFIRGVRGIRIGCP